MASVEERIMIRVHYVVVQPVEMEENLYASQQQPPIASPESEIWNCWTSRTLRFVR